MTGDATSEYERLPQPEEGGKPKRRRKAFVLLLCISLLGLTLGLISSWKNKASAKPDETIRGNVTLEPKKPENFLKKITYIALSHDDRGADLAGAEHDRINILLLGMGGPGHDGPFLTDTIIIASIKPSTKQIALISIPRDLSIYIPGYGDQKINHADAYGEVKKTNWGGAFATELIAKNFNIDIPYYIRLDFAAFQEIIDEVGGVTVHVDKSFTDPMFPAPYNEFQTVSFAEGDQTMNGLSALNFARSRHGNNNEGSDFARARRQQKILLALKEKLTSLGVIANPVRVSKIMNSLESHVTTNMEFTELVSLARLGRNIDTEHITSLVFDSAPNGYLRSSFTSGGAFVLVPKSGSFNEMSQAMTNIFNPDTTTSLLTPKEGITTLSTTPQKNESAIVEIQNATWNAGLAARVRRRLENRTIMVETIGNATQKPLSRSGVYKIIPVAPDTIVTMITEELQIPLNSTLPIGIVPATSTEILILLGDDFSD